MDSFAWIRDNWQLLASIVTLILGYQKLKDTVETLKSAINGVGKKQDMQNAETMKRFNEIEKKVVEYHIEEVLRHGHALEELAFIKGELSGIYKPKSTNGHA